MTDKLRKAEKQALKHLEPMASKKVIKAAKRATRSGTYVWIEDPQGCFGLCKVRDTSQAVIVIYPSGLLFDFEVDATWMGL